MVAIAHIFPICPRARLLGAFPINAPALPAAGEQLSVVNHRGKEKTSVAGNHSSHFALERREGRCYGDWAIAAHPYGDQRDIGTTLHSPEGPGADHVCAFISAALHFVIILVLSMAPVRCNGSAATPRHVC